MNRDETTKSTTAHPTDSPEQLSLNAPCTTWVEALPLGNGILGVMDGAHAAHTTLWINHHATWSGHPATAYQLPQQPTTPPGSSKHASPLPARTTPPSPAS